MKIFKVQQNSQLISHHQISFKGEFDKYAYLSRNMLQERISNLKEVQESQLWNINININEKDSELQALETQINDLQKIASGKDKYIENLKSQSNNILLKIEQIKKQIKLLTDKNSQLLSTYLKEKQSIDNKIETEKLQKLENIQDSFSQNLELSNNGPKKLIIEHVINPILSSYENDTTNLKNISFEMDTLNSDEQKAVKNAIFAWITSLTDANYAKLDATNFDDTNNLVDVLRKISLIADRNYEENGSLSVTFIDNLDKFEPQNLTNTNLSFFINF